MQNKPRLLRPAENLNEVFDTLNQDPLIERDEFDAFYCGEVNNPGVRGVDEAARIRFALEPAFNSRFFKALVIGHSGVGKSTELTKLLFKVEGKFRWIRFKATSDLDPVNFRPFDVLLLILIDIAQKTAEVLQEHNSLNRISPNLLDDIWNWFAQEKVTREEALRIAGGIEAGAGAEGVSIWAKMLGLFAHIRGEMKYSSDRKTEVVEYRLIRISSLIALANRLLDECNRLLLETENKEWLIIGEDFDKPGIPPERVEDFFITNSNIIKELRSHAIFTIPVTLAYSSLAPLLPVSDDCRYNVPDTPVFNPAHEPYHEGREAVQSILGVRLKSDLFDKGVMTRLIVASGGNLRDLFSMVSDSAITALLRNSQTISGEDAVKAMNKMRREYRHRLGESPYDKVQISVDQKIETLKNIYQREAKISITDAVMHSLLRARAVQEFNGRGWYGVHPLVVDILKELKVLDEKEPGGTE